jgi:hypothetical protein
MKYNKNLRLLSITHSNENLLKGEELFKVVYNTIINNEEFKKFGCPMENKS